MYQPYGYLQHQDALAVAARHDKPEIMKILIEAKAELERSDMHVDYTWRERDHASPLATAIASGRIDAMELLLEAKARISVPRTGYIHDLIRCAIEACEEHDDDDVLGLLLDANASLLVDRWGRNALRRACEMNRPSIVEMLLDLNISPNYVYEKKNPYTLLIKAVSQNRIDVGRTLIDAKANIDHRPQHGPTALMIAVREKYIELIQLLVENNASLELTDHADRTALDYAIQASYSDPTAIPVVKILAKANASLERRNFHGNTPLVDAVVRGHVNMTRTLVDAKADVDASSLSGYPTLMFAAGRGVRDIVETLLSADPASFDAQDQFGMTALMYAARSDASRHDAHIVRMLLEHAKTHCAAENNNEPPQKRFKKTE